MIAAMSPPSHAERAGALLQDADLCVKCGLCLPHCPTYLDSEHEADSPRGRIALAQGLIGGTLADGASLRAHLDGCLSCRKCEAVCPARVPYGRILDAARQELAARDPQPDRSLRWLSRLLVPAPMRVLLRGLIALLRKLYNGLTLGEVLAVDARSEMARLGLNEHLSSQRSNGLRAMIERIRAVAAG